MAEIADLLHPFARTLVPEPWNRQLVADRKTRIVERLRSEGIGVVASFESGSFSHGTGVRDNFDVDLMVRLEAETKPRRPSTTLAKVREALYWDYEVKDARVSNPVVQVEFWTEPHFEVVPAFYEDEIGSDTIYEIGGRSDEWTESAPSAHKRYVNTQNDRLDKRLKGLIRLVKAWKHENQVPVSSFYLEMRVASRMMEESVLLYCMDLPVVFRSILEAGVADMNDPSGYVGRIPACSSQENREATRSAIRAAIDRLDRAEDARLSGHGSDYWYEMSRVFGFDYPYPA